MKTDKYDITFSNLVRVSADWTCEICGKQSPPGTDNGLMDCSHDRSRRHPWTRYDPRNAICSCRGCHMKTTEDHDFHVESFNRIKTEDARLLMRERSNDLRKLTKKMKDSIRMFYLKEEFPRIHQMRMDGVQGKIVIRIPKELQ